MVLTSDFHINSYHCKEDSLTLIPQFVNSSKVDAVYFCGDLFEGTGHLYKGQMQEIKNYGLDAMIDYANKKLPVLKDAKWRMITGNHDDDITDKYGLDPIKKLSKMRDDIDYLGRDVADIIIDGLKIRLLHPEGGGEYALTFGIQKYIRNLRKEEMPDVLIAGHKHVYATFDYQGVLCVMVPSMQLTNSYLSRKGIDSQQGIVLLNYVVKNKKLLNHHVSETKL